jgi:hypothetical protein
LKKCGPEQFLREDPGHLEKYLHGVSELTSTPLAERYLATQLSYLRDHFDGLSSLLIGGLAPLRLGAFQIRTPDAMAISEM